MKPKHIGIIPDGNRRWAKSKGIAEYLAHSTPGNYHNLSKIFNTAMEEGVDTLSVWAFSTENWRREKKEVDELLGVIERSIDSFILAAPKDQYRFRVIGRRDNIPSRMEMKIRELEEETKNYTDIQIVVGLDYGGRDEIIRAINKAIKDGKQIDEEEFKKYLDTNDISDPDLIIRTGGEKRLSGYMPFQSIYSELIFLDILFPDFTPNDLINAIKEFEDRKRRFGS
ncbi:di-trans,poly-cis-decaprenylcistransferase [Candidatus Pacearchaeota archaeon]|nr:di-trans,poly-cis-decaprenylcistransferase [Candidatus Pacearchaeota archaeon]